MVKLSCGCIFCYLKLGIMTSEIQSRHCLRLMFEKYKISAPTAISPPAPTMPKIPAQLLSQQRWLSKPVYVLMSQSHLHLANNNNYNSHHHHPSPRLVALLFRRQPLLRHYFTILVSLLSITTTRSAACGRGNPCCWSKVA